jgi:putative transposase
VGGPEQGYDAGKKAFGRKRHILVDASGLILLAHIHAASLHAFVGARPRVEAAPVTALPRLELIWAHGACTGPCAKWLERQISWRIKGPYA